MPLVRRQTDYTRGPWPVICRDLVDAFGAKRVGEIVAETAERVDSWAAGDSAPPVRSQHALKRLYATLFACELHCELLDLEVAREAEVTRVERLRNYKQRRAKP